MPTGIRAQRAVRSNPLLIGVALATALGGCLAAADMPAASPRAVASRCARAPEALIAAQPSASPAGPPPSAPSIQLQLVTTGLEQPTGIVNACDGSGRLFILEQRGRIRIVGPDGVLREEPFLDLTDRVFHRGESGLLGLAFHPDYVSNGRFFTYYTNLDGDSVIAEFHVRADDANRADEGFEIELLTIEQPDTDHKGGQMAFDREGNLWIGFGDGGGSGDTYGNGQNLGTLLAKIIRIDIDQVPYGIPEENPFADGGGPPETWAWGLRNPWRFSFDPVNGDLYIADVGQGGREEINRERAGTPGGRNYGWSLMEGTQCRADNDAECTEDLVPPIVEYRHDPECAVVGGYVSRGPDPKLWGSYLYGDFCSGKIWALAAADDAAEPVLLADTELVISSFGVGEDLELYVLDFVAGELLRIISGS